MHTDVTDADFEAEVVERSKQTPVVVDLWAEWCGPCRQLGPIIEKVVAETDGQVHLAKVDVDQNPQVSAAFKVQGIPAVYALSGGEVVDGFVGAQGEDAVREFVAKLIPSEQDNEIEALIEAGDEDSLRRVLDLDSAHEAAVLGLAEILIGSDRVEESEALLGRIPESAETRRLAALARTSGEVDDAEITDKLDELLAVVATDEAARQEFVDLLERLGADDPRTSDYRRQLTAQLF